MRSARLIAVLALSLVLVPLTTQAQPSVTLALIDLHFHAERGLSPDKVLQTMDQVGVAVAGNGAKGPDNIWEPFVLASASRFLPFAGQGPIGRMVQELGERAWTLNADPINSYLESLERGLRAGRFRGIGELFVNNTNSHPRGFSPTKYPADSPLVRRLLALSAKYAVPLSIHMDAEADSVAGLEALVGTERSGVVIWAHCGTWADAALIRRLLQQQPNLLCELSWRDAVHLAKAQRSRGAEITGFRTKLAEDWRELLEAFSDRFLVGTDADDPGQYTDIIDFYRKVLGQLSPDAAQRIGSGNAKRIFRLD